MVMNKLTKKDQELLMFVEKGEWKSVKNLRREKKRYAVIARYTLHQDKREKGDYEGFY